MTAMFAYNLVTISKAYAQQIPVTPLSNMPSISDNCHLGDRCASSRNTVHTGVDYLTESGTDVWAICDGIVKYARSSDIEIWNRFVVIEHPDCGGYSKLYAYYGHIDSELQENNHVTRGDKIGSVADWGENSHLHFGLATKLINRGWGYQEGDPVENGWIDPESFVTMRDAQTAETQAYVFATPSRNIYCRLGEYGVRCDVIKHEWAHWECVPAGCYGSRFMLPPYGKASAVLSSDSMLGITENILEYGSSISSYGVTCKSETTGLTCVNIDGNQMHLNREFFQLQ